jgi:polyisoprenoid-binding protein YceI
MRKYSTTLVLLMIAVFTYSCADPAADKPKATTGTATTVSESPKPAGTESLVISPQNSKVEFVASKVTRSHHGSFKQFSGKIELAPGNIPVSRVSIDIDTASVEADDPELTGHLKTPDFFDVAKFPKATFVSAKIEPLNTGGGQTFTVTGNLELHGVTKSISFPANIQETADSVSVDADFAINRKDFGIVYAGKADDLIRDNVVLKLALKVPRAK